MASRRPGAAPPAGDDPEPQPPAPLDPDACCGQGCDPCVFELHEQALERWRAARRAWRERHGLPAEPGGPPT